MEPSMNEAYKNLLAKHSRLRKEFASIVDEYVLLEQKHDRLVLDHTKLQEICDQMKQGWVFQQKSQEEGTANASP